jgi:hypothetical protein
MLSSDELGREFVRLARDEALSSTLRMVTGVKKAREAQKKYERLYKKYDNVELFRNVAAIAIDSACEKLLALVDSGQFTHTPIAGDPNLSNEMFKNGGWIDRFSIFGRSRQWSS